MELTKDTYEYLLNFADDRTLINMLSVNKKFAQKLENEKFFEQLLNKRYPYLLEYKKENETFKNFYLRKIYYIAKIEEKYKVPYYQIKDYDPEYYYLDGKKRGIDYQRGFLRESILIRAAKMGNFDIVKDITREGDIRLLFAIAAIKSAKDNGHYNISDFLTSEIRNIIPESQINLLEFHNL